MTKLLKRTQVADCFIEQMGDAPAATDRCFRFDADGHAEWTSYGDLIEDGARARWYGHIWTRKDFTIENEPAIDFKADQSALEGYGFNIMNSGGNCHIMVRQHGTDSDVDMVVTHANGAWFPDEASNAPYLLGYHRRDTDGCWIDDGESPCHEFATLEALLAHLDCEMAKEFEAKIGYNPVAEGWSNDEIRDMCAEFIALERDGQ